jgi:two-component system response regulator AlgR
MKILIVDDEAPARVRLRTLLAEIDPNLIVVGEAADGIEAVRQAFEAEPDLVLLDISMPRLGGLAVAREMARAPQPPAVVFVTAHDEYAVAAFEVSAVDYLLKPVRKERLANALNKARRLTEATWRGLEVALPPEPQPARAHLCSHTRQGLRLVPVEAVVYFRAEQKYTVARTEVEEWLIEDSLKALEEEFGERFLRIHRNALVAAERVAGLERFPGGAAGLRLRGIAEILEVSRRHLPAIRAWLKRPGAV